MKLNLNYQNWHLNHAKAWKIMPSPARPSLGEITIFEKYLLNCYKEKQTKLNVLILGSTPEFRDLCNSKIFNVTCIDINAPIYKALTLLQKSPNKREQFINTNWLTFNNPKRYDVIIGDAVTAMFGLGYYEQFFRNMSKHLVHRGYLIIRVPYQNPDFDIEPKKVIQNYRNLKATNRMNIYTATYNYFAMYYLNKQKSSISLSVLYDKIKELYKSKIILPSEFWVLKRYYQNLTLELSYPTEEFFNSTAQKYFRIIAKEFGLDYITSFSNPIYILAN